MLKSGACRGGGGALDGEEGAEGINLCTARLWGIYRKAVSNLKHNQQ
jgi:hypothetical protein